MIWGVSDLNGTAAIVAGMAGVVVSIPGTAVAYAVPDEGPVRVPSRWWTGAPAPHWMLVVAAFVAGVSGALVAANVRTLAVLPAFWLVAVVGTMLAVVDIRRRRLPHLLTGLLWAASVVCFTVDAVIHHDADAVLRAGISAAVVAGVFLALALALPGQLGLGDVSLAGVLAFTLAWVGLQILMTGFVVGLTIQAAGGLVAVARHRNMRHRVAMGPALLVGWLVAVSTGP